MKLASLIFIASVKRYYFVILFHIVHFDEKLVSEELSKIKLLIMAFYFIRFNPPLIFGTILHHHKVFLHILSTDHG
jgi:hypothetical protein